MLKNKGFVAIIVALSFLFINETHAQNQVVGTVNYGDDENAPISSVQMELYDLYDSLIMTSNTDTYGYYEFTNIPDGEYLLKSTTDIDPSIIDLTDAYFIMLHLLGMYDLTESQYAAADVNNSESVDWGDYILIVVNYLLNGESFPAGDWQFEEHYISFSNRAQSDTVKSSVVASDDVAKGGDTNKS